MSQLNPGILQDGVHPLVRQLDSARGAQGLSWAELERRAGLGSGVTSPWRHGACAMVLQNLEAAAGAVGLGLVLRPLRETRARSAASATLLPGTTHRSRCGALVTIDRQLDGALLGTAYGGRLALRWSLQGLALPLGGECAYDIIDQGTTRPQASGLQLQEKP